MQAPPFLLTAAQTLDRILQVDEVSPEDNGSLYDPNYTYSYSKYSCVKGFYFAHVVFNYFIFLSGLGAFITRLLPSKYKWIHSWCGRIYILSMLWSTVTSLLINNTGLPLANLYNFAMVMIGLTIGWVIIVLHINIMNSKATNLVQERILANGGIPKDTSLNNMIGQAKMEIAESKTWMQRFFSLKALHGILFFASWMNLAGRIFASNQSGDFACYSYPAYKPIDTPKFNGEGKSITLVPEDDPNYDNLPWANMQNWVMMTIFGSLAGAAVFGFIFSYFAARRALAKTQNDEVEMSSSFAKETSQHDDHNDEGTSSEGNGDKIVEVVVKSSEDT